MDLSESVNPETWKKVPIALWKNSFSFIIASFSEPINYQLPVTLAGSSKTMSDSLNMATVHWTNGWLVKARQNDKRSERTPNFKMFLQEKHVGQKVWPFSSSQSFGARLAPSSAKKNDAKCFPRSEKKAIWEKIQDVMEPAKKNIGTKKLRARLRATHKTICRVLSKHQLNSTPIGKMPNSVECKSNYNAKSWN